MRRVYSSSRCVWRFVHSTPENPPLFGTVTKSANGGIRTVWEVTGEARRKVGAWPTPENVADRLVAALNEAAANATTPEERTKIQKAAGAVGDLGMGVFANLVTVAMTGAI